MISMDIKTGYAKWRWHEGWVVPPCPGRGVGNMRTHGVGVLPDGRVVVFHQAIPAVLIYSPAGELLDRWGTYPGAHGLTLVGRGEELLLWLTDEALASVDLVDLHGHVRQQIDKPDHPAYQSATFAPTWVAEETEGGQTKRIWVADGYGAHLVHAHAPDGTHEFTLDGTEGAGRFNCPHGVAVDPRPGREGRLLVADRGNRRVQEFARDGTFLGTWGDAFLHSPDGFTFHGDHCAIPELYGRTVIVGPSNDLVDTIGDQPNARHLTGWPNVQKSIVLPGLFNSPHGAAWGPNGDLYVVEWIQGGRVVRLEFLGRNTGGA
jgi:hypothetical protein